MGSCLGREADHAQPSSHVQPCDCVGYPPNSAVVAETTAPDVRRPGQSMYFIVSIIAAMVSLLAVHVSPLLAFFIAVCVGVCVVLRRLPAVAGSENESLKAHLLEGATHGLKLLLSDLLDDESGTAAEAVSAQRLVHLLGVRCCLERFLVARQGSLEAAQAMFRDTVAWRARVADRIRTDKDAVYNWNTASNYFPSKCCVTEQGSSGPRAVVFLRDPYLFALAMNFTPNMCEDVFVRTLEDQLQVQSMAADMRKKLGIQEGGLDQTTLRTIEIHDLAGLHVGHSRCVPKLRQLAKAVAVGQLYYPEVLDRCFFLNTPWFFTVIARFVGAVLHENTKRKLVFTSENTHSDLLEYMSRGELQALRNTMPPYQSGQSNQLRPMGRTVADTSIVHLSCQ